MDLKKLGVSSGPVVCGGDVAEDEGEDEAPEIPESVTGPEGKSAAQMSAEIVATYAKIDVHKKAIAKLEPKARTMALALHKMAAKKSFRIHGAEGSVLISSVAGQRRLDAELLAQAVPEETLRFCYRVGDPTVAVKFSKPKE